MIRKYALECKSKFLSEKRTELYEQYSDGVSEEKIWFCAKSSRGVVGSAGHNAREVRNF
jgi:hypothetical protein